MRGTPISTATDVYGLGLVLYELLTGEKAQTIETGSPAELVQVVCERELPPAVAVDGELGAILQKALAKDPAERYSSVDLLRDDLRRYLEGLPLHARQPTILYRAAKFARLFQTESILAEHEAVVGAFAIPGRQRAGDGIANAEGMAEVEIAVVGETQGEREVTTVRALG